MDEIFARKGKKIIHFDLKKDKPSKSDISKAILGPTGNLRAPAAIKGRILLIGFDEDIYREVLK